MLRRIIWKTAVTIIDTEAKVECGAYQLCAGLEAGNEAANHVVNDLFAEHAGSGWGVLLVDAAKLSECIESQSSLMASTSPLAPCFLLPQQHQ